MEDEVLDNRYKTDYDRSFVPFGPGGAEGFSKMDLVVPKIGSVSNRNNEHGAEGFSKMDLVVPKLNFDNPEEGGGQWTTLMNKIDETDINELWGEAQPLERELASIRELMQKSNSMNINVDEAQRGYIDGEMKKLSDRTQEIQEELGDIYEDIKSNQEDIDSSPIKLSEQLRTKYALSEKNSNPVTYLRNELMSDLGGSMNQLGSQIAATGLIAAANATGVFFGPLGIALSGGVRFAADRYARERETNAEVGGAYKERVEQFQDGYRARNGLSPEAEIPPEIDDYIRLEASKGMNDLRAENMALQWGDYAQSGMGMMPWTLGNTNAGKISSFLMKQMIGSIMEGVEEGVQDVAGQRANNQLEGTLWKKNKNG